VNDAEAGLWVQGLDLIESDEVFLRACAVAAELGLNPKRTNLNATGVSR
jgi:acetyl-CoA C-acetyltransferase